MENDSDNQLINVIQARLMKQWQKEGPVPLDKINEIHKIAAVIAKGDKVMKDNMN